MQILVYCPLNPTVPRIYARTLQSLLTLTWDFPLEIVFGKNDHTDKNGKLKDLLDKHNRARQMTLDGGYDALLMTEADMILPQNVLLRLAAVDADVAYGLYVSRHGSFQWLAFDVFGEGGWKSIDRNRKYCVEHWGQVVQTKGVGMGCTLIKRHVLEALEFRLGGSNATDWYFSLDCIERGFTQAHDLGVVCGHITPEGGVMWPSLDRQKVMFEIEPLEQ